MREEETEQNCFFSKAWNFDNDKKSLLSTVDVPEIRLNC